MYYEINVFHLEDNAMMPGKKYYRHLFATAPHSLQTTEELKKAYPRIKAAFPQPEYMVEVYVYPEEGHSIDRALAEELATLQIKDKVS